MWSGVISRRHLQPNPTPTLALTLVVALTLIPFSILTLILTPDPLLSNR